MAVFDDYYEGIQPLNFDEEFRAAFGRRWARFASNYSALVVDRLVDRLEVQGFRFADAIGRRGPVGHLAGQRPRRRLGHGAHRGAHQARRVRPRRADDRDALPRITVEDPFDAITAPDPRDRRRRLAGLKRWIDETGHLVVYLYLPEWVVSLRTRSPIPSRLDRWLEPKAVWPDTRGARALGTRGRASRSCATRSGSCRSCPCATGHACGVPGAARSSR